MAILYMMVGLSGSGKSTYAKEIQGVFPKITKIHSSDELREELFNDINFQGKNDEIFAELHRRIREDLQQGYDVVFDATNLNSKKRRHFIESLNKLDVKKIAYVTAAPYHICLERNNNRDKKVPEEVIKRQREKFNIPIYQEGFDEIRLIYSDDWKSAEIIKDIEKIKEFDQENKHHTLTLGEHCGLTGKILETKAINNTYDDTIYDLTLIEAGHLHDIGKLYTKTFINISDGSISESSHFYGHENVGAYESLFLLKHQKVTDENILNISSLINYHMRLYFLKAEKSINKFKRFVGEDFYNRLKLLNEADKMAH